VRDVIVWLARKRPKLPRHGFLQECEAAVFGKRQKEARERSANLAHGDGPPTVMVSGLGRRFGRFWAVDGVDMEVKAGEMVALLGPNGAGKSTVIRMICGLLVPTRGTIRVAGLDPARQPVAVKSRIGYMTQHFSLYADLTVVENVEFYGAAYGLRGRVLREAVDRWVSFLELGEYAGRLAGELPPGWARRVAFACAVIGEPPVLLLDEPTSGVDRETSDLLWYLCARQARGGAAVLVTTHWLGEAERCDRVCIMSAGRVVGEGAPQELVRRLRGRVLGVRADPIAAGLSALKAWPRARAVAVGGQWIRVEVDGQAAEAEAEARAVVTRAGATVQAIQVLEPNLDDLFVHLVTEDNATSGPKTEAVG
jgi:ABC-2 type transport system ATP-binding protein